MHQTINLLGALALCSLLQFWVGCKQAVVVPREYSAVIEEIKYPAGTYFSPSRGVQQYTEIYVRVAEKNSAGKPTLLGITVLGPYARSLDGDIGNVVSFSYSGELRLRDTISIEQLTNYRISRR